jgi:hypothetical protein
MERVLERAAALGVAMEINSQPDRLDLSDVHARLAKEKGATLVVDTDAHSMANLDLIRYGVFTARRAGLAREDVLNAWPCERMRAALRKRGGARAKSTKQAAAGAAAKAVAPKKQGATKRAAAAGKGPTKKSAAAKAAPAGRPAARKGAAKRSAPKP